MTDIERGRGSHRGVYFLLIAALGFALSGCGGGASSSSSASAPESSSPTQQTAPAPVDTSTPAPTQGTSSGSDASSSSTGSGSTASDPPTASAGNITLNWVPPTENVDGTALTNLAGYDIHYGTASGKYTQTIAISNPGIATYVVQNLTPGTYYFSVTAVNSDGTESPMSSEVSTTVN